MIRLCFVCLGNICRSPTAHAVMRQVVTEAGLADRIAIDSAGTGDWHLGAQADPRTRQTAQRRGLDMEAHRAQQFTSGSFAGYDLILVMDRKNLRDVEALTADPAERAKVRLLRSFDPAAPAGAEVPDPYYGGPEGFEEVFDVCEAACRGLLAHLRARLAGAAGPG